ncbi:THO2 plays a role in transcriptional elongation [Diaporthe australafricana]|uniref:THO2 plays a role in transcriptional elongation n=1 Tax=Diaporthe australafricana TaxID=127596 RepID=A0ABR3X237_9PEZI
MPPPDTNRAPSPERQPPTGPSSSRPRRAPSTQFDHAANSSTAPPAMPAGGGHSDRAHQFEQPMHPDRMRHIVPPPPPPPPPREPSHSRPQVPPIHTSDRVATPTGPSASRQGQSSHPNTPIAEQNAPYSAPTGPSASKDRQRGSVRRQLEKLQDNITPGNTKRDGDHRRPRQSMPDSDAQILTGASPVSTPVQERPDPVRRNMMQDRPVPGNEMSGLPLRDSRSDAHEELAGSRAIASAIPTTNPSNLDDLLENQLLILAIATLCLAVLGNLQALVANHDIGAIAEVTVAEARAAVEEEQATNGAIAAEEDRCAVGPGTDRETGLEKGQETDPDGLVMIAETPVATTEAQAGSGGVTFQKCRQATETSDPDVRTVPYMVSCSCEEGGGLARPQVRRSVR